MPKYPKTVTMDHLTRAIEDLGINQPFTARVVGNRLEIHPLGARAPVTWPPTHSDARAPVRSRLRRKRRPPPERTHL